jgi:peptidoglycan hydrolase CwlO-like protein
MKSTLEDRLDSFREQEINEVKNAVLRLQDTQSDKDERIRRLERQIEKKDEQIETLESRLEEVENRSLTDLLPI